eukprot:39170-Chlamydomonas_euryale.AAC.7
MATYLLSSHCAMLHRCIDPLLAVVRSWTPENADFGPPGRRWHRQQGDRWEGRGEGGSIGVLIVGGRGAGGVTATLAALARRAPGRMAASARPSKTPGTGTAGRYVAAKW